LRRLDYTPLETDYVFKLFDLDGDGQISLSDFNKVVQDLEHKKVSKKSYMDVARETIINFGLGSIAGATGAFTVYPIDLVKTRMQNQRFKPGVEKIIQKHVPLLLQSINNRRTFGII